MSNRVSHVAAEQSETRKFPVVGAVKVNQTSLKKLAPNAPQETSVGFGPSVVDPFVSNGLFPTIATAASAQLSFGGPTGAPCETSNSVVPVAPFQPPTRMM